MILLLACEANAPGTAPQTRPQAPTGLSFEQARRLPPMDLSGVSPWRQTLAAAGPAFCRVREGNVECWGGAYGASPRRIPGIDDALELVMSWSAGCAFRRGGRLTCWSSDGSTVDHPLPGAVDWEGSCAIDAGGSARCFELCDEMGRCFRRFEELPLRLSDVAILSSHPQCTCALTRRGVLTCAGPECEEWSGHEGPHPHVVEGMSGTMLHHGFFEVCVGRDDRLLCRGGHTVATDAPDRRNAIRTHTQIVPLPPGLSAPVRSVALPDWECLLHAEGELSCRHLWGPFQRVRHLPGPVRQIAGEGPHLCVELTGGEVRCRTGALRAQLGSERLESRWVTVPNAPP